MTDPTSPKPDLTGISNLLDSPAARLARTFEDSPAQRAIRAFENSGAQRLTRALEAGPLIQMQKRLEAATSATRMFEQQRPAIVAFMKEAEAVQRTLQRPEVVDALARFQRQSSAITRALESAILPTPSAIAALSAKLARAVEPYQVAFASNSAWEASLAARMTALNTAWAPPDHFGVSMIGFARLSRLSDAVHTAEPYGESVSELVADELGAGVNTDEDGTPIERDVAAVESGLNPELITFPAASFRNVVFEAGFEFHFTGAPVPQAVEAADIDAVFDPIHSLVLTEIEQRLRQLVEEKLQDLAGEKWVRRRVSEPVRSRWIERQSEERDAGRPVFDLVQYADFMDISDVIVQSNNWRQAFEPIFQNRRDFTVSLGRLHPVRKAIAHGRPLGRADVLTLVSEATRILNALGVQVLN